MTLSELLVDQFERLRDAVYPAVNGLSVAELTFRPDGASNSIAWLAWHLTRVQDRGVATIAGTEAVWTASGWYERSGLALDPTDTGYGHDPAAVATVVAEAPFLLDYFEEVHQHTVEWLRPLDDPALARVLEDTLDSRGAQVTVASGIVAVLVDDLQHVGQAAYVRTLVHRR